VRFNSTNKIEVWSGVARRGLVRFGETWHGQARSGMVRWGEARFGRVRF